MKLIINAEWDKYCYGCTRDKKEIQWNFLENRVEVGEHEYKNLQSQYLEFQK